MGLILSRAQAAWLHCPTDKHMEQTTGKETLISASANVQQVQMEIRFRLRVSSPA